MIALVDRGDFAAAERAIDAAISSEIGAPHEALRFERERMRRIAMDFGLTRDDAIARVRRQIPDLTEAEFDAFDAEGLLESMRIDGQLRYFNRAPSNLFRLSARARAMRADPDQPFRDGPFETLHPHHAEVVTAAQQTGERFVASRRVRVVQSLTVKPDAVPAGEVIRAWIPFPRAIPGQQQDVILLASEPAARRVAPESTLQRTVYLEKPAEAGRPTEFSITYEVTIHAQHRAIAPDAVLPIPAADTDDGQAIAPYLAEEPPHVVFTDALRLHSARVVGDETNPYRIARKLFAAVDDIPWAGAREYSTISNISEYALNAGHADCGQQTLLLIALLRLNGIPARWQSGWTFSDNEVGYDNMHDWGMLYLPPYGWVPMDVTTGRLDSDDPSLRWFYLGGLDAYRIAFNDAISTPFDPPKQYFRSETVDSQRGEAEWSGGNLYFDQWDYRFNAVVLPPAPAPSTSGEHP
ncbi:transglutaminase domain-containing protein [Xanthomonadaceae bacterium JHOS43]|nr:transglutaminase domain-containing protein [Xanthomonadaceae bacterium JHOS43]